MICFEILDDGTFEVVPLSANFLRRFVSRFVTYLRSHTPPLTGEYTRTSYVKYPGVSIKWGQSVSVFVILLILQFF